MKTPNLSSADRHVRRIGCRLAIWWLALAGTLRADAQRVLPLESERGHLFANVVLHDSLPARAMLESGIVFPLIDSALVWSHPELFRPRRLDDTVRFRMANGARFAATHKLPPGLRVCGSRSLCDTYVVDMHRCDFDLFYPLHTFSTDTADRAGIFGLALGDGELRMLCDDELPAPGDGWTICPMLRDDKYGMYLVRIPLAMYDRGEPDARPMDLVVDLGNANLLALFEFKPVVGDFVSRTNLPVREAATASGRSMRIIMPAQTRFSDAFTFRNLPVLLLERPMRLPGDGFLGTRFFERFRVVFDFRHERLWLANAPAQE